MGSKYILSLCLVVEKGDSFLSVSSSIQGNPKSVNRVTGEPTQMNKFKRIGHVQKKDQRRIDVKYRFNDRSAKRKNPLADNNNRLSKRSIDKRFINTLNIYSIDKGAAYVQPIRYISVALYEFSV